MKTTLHFSNYIALLFHPSLARKKSPQPSTNEIAFPQIIWKGYNRAHEYQK